MEEVGLSRILLKVLVEARFFDKESKSIYSLTYYFADEYKRIQMKSEKIYFLMVQHFICLDY